MRLHEGVQEAMRTTAYGLKRATTMVRAMLDSAKIPDWRNACVAVELRGYAENEPLGSGLNVHWLVQVLIAAEAQLAALESLKKSDTP
jgi:hypothetical protein